LLSKLENGLLKIQIQFYLFSKKYKMNCFKVLFLVLFIFFSGFWLVNSNSNSFANKSPQLLWQWQIYSYGNKIIKEKNINITYDWIEGTICNKFKMDYKLDVKNQTITSLNITHTEKFCDLILNELENLFLNLTGNKYEYKNDSIKIFTDSGIVFLLRPDNKSNPQDSRCIFDWGIIHEWNCEFEDWKICNINDYFEGICKKSSYSKINSELIAAYNWSYSKQITTMQDYYLAKADKPITRAELAKMIVWFSTNVMNKEVPQKNKCKFNDIWNIDPNLEIAILQICNLWIMWKWIKTFRPNDYVTRAEFGTVLSRTLWWNENEWWSIYYENHLKMLKLKWIMNKIDFPLNKEIKGYVMLMLMRADKMFY